GTDSEFREDEITLSHTRVITPRLTHQLRFLLGQYHAPTNSLNPNPKIVVLDAFTVGGAPANQLRTEHHIELTEIVSCSAVRHLVKFGFDIPDWSRRVSNA